MDITFERLDLEASRAATLNTARFEPAQVFARNDGETWWVADGPVRMDAPVPLVFYRQEQFVRIPLIPYLLNTAPDLALAYPLAIGLRCAAQLLQPLRRIHIVTGVPVEQLHDADAANGLRYWVGFGFLLQS